MYMKMKRINTYQISKAMYLCMCFCSISLICLSFANTKCFLDFCKFIIRFLNYLYVLQKRQWHPIPVLLPGKIPWVEEPGRLQSMGSLRVRHDWATSLPLFTFMHWRKEWQPLQCSCLENPRDARAWWVSSYRVAQSRTRLKRLSMQAYKENHILCRVSSSNKFSLYSIFP